MNNEAKEVVYLHLDDIIPNRFQPREVFDERALKELAVSIKQHGVIQPITVRKIKDNNKYEIIAGERRYKATALAGLTTIPAIIRNLDDKEAAKVALLENLQRRNLNPIEEARTYQKIIELDDMTQEELAKTMGKSQSAVANKLRLLALPDEIQKSLLKEEISERHARALLNIEDTEEQKEMLKRVTKEKMTVRELENQIKRAKMPEDKPLQGNEDINSLINPSPVPIQNNVNSNETSNFLMDPISSDEGNNQIINYGEISDEEEEETPEENYENSSISDEPVDLHKMKTSSMDINNLMNPNVNKENNNGNTDSLLDINPPTNNGQNNNFFTPAEEALRDSENNNENKEDYFSAPDLMSIQLPNSSPNAQASNTYREQDSNPGTNLNSLLEFSKAKPVSKDKKAESLTDVNQTLFQKPTDNKEYNSNTKKANRSLGMALIDEAYNNSDKLKNEQYNIQQMVNSIRRTLSDLEQHGAKIDTEEMDFENQYQILIKIDKNSNI